jgi:hypothetical protein
VLDHYGHLEAIPLDASSWDADVARRVRTGALVAALAEGFELALLFRELARLVIEPSLLASADELKWAGPTADFETVCAYLDDPGLAERAAALAP